MGWRVGVEALVGVASFAQGNLREVGLIVVLSVAAGEEAWPAEAIGFVAAVHDVSWYWRKVFHADRYQFGSLESRFVDATASAGHELERVLRHLKPAPGLSGPLSLERVHGVA